MTWMESYREFAQKKSAEEFLKNLQDKQVENRCRGCDAIFRGEKALLLCDNCETLSMSELAFQVEQDEQEAGE